MKSPRYYRADTAQRQSEFSSSNSSRKSPGYGSSFLQASKSPAQLKTDTVTLQKQENPLQLAQEEDELQMKQNPLQLAQEEDELQMKENPLQKAGMEEDELQMKSEPAQKKEVPQQLSSGTGSKMPKHIQANMEGAFATDFSDVTIHQGEQARQVGALAYTQGNQIHFAPGQYDPQSQRGQELLGHELTHVVQQRQGRVQPTTQTHGMPVNDDRSLEAEADHMGKRALSLQRKEEGTSSQFD